MYLPIPDITLDISRRFWAMVKIAGVYDCWLWTGTTSQGYGRFRIGGHKYLASRIMLAEFEQRNNDLEVCHSCNNTQCVNPVHLRFGTRKDNMQDKIAAGTAPRGENHGAAKLTHLDVELIRQLNKYIIHKQIAEYFNVSISTIRSILNGRRWSYE